jgi:hypothetical protein
VAVVLGGPVFRWSHYVWAPVMGRPNNQPGQFWNLVKGLVSVIAWLPFYGIVIGLLTSLATVFFPGLGNCAPIASSVVVCSLMGAGLQAVTGNVHQTPAALTAQIAYTERYSGPLLYQLLGLAMVMMLSIVMFWRETQGADRGEAKSDLRFWAVAVTPVVVGIVFWSGGWFVLGSYLLFSGILVIFHSVSRPGWQ